MPQAFYILFGALYTVACATALGKILLRSLGVRLYREEEHLLGFMAGAPLLSLLVFGTCMAGLARKGFFLWLGVAILAAGWYRGVHRPSGDPLPPVPRLWKGILIAVFIVFGVLYLSHAMAPERSPDGPAYHLSLVARYLREHRIPRITTNIYANLSQGAEMLFLFAFSFGRYSAAAMVHCAFLFALPLMMLCYARRFGLASAGACGAVLFFVSPVVGIDGTSAYIDLAAAAVVFAVFYLCRIWESERESSLLVPIGLLAGFGYAVKYTAGLAVPYALGFVLWKSWRKRAALVRPAVVISICALAMMLPWVLKNWIWIGNPFSPLANALFPNPYVTVAFEREWSAYLRHYDIKAYWDWPAAVTMGGQLSGVVGPVFLLAPLALFALCEREGRRLWCAAAVFGLPYLLNIGTRFLIPPMPFVSLAMGLFFTEWRLAAPAVAVVHAVLSWPDVAMLYTGPNTWQLTNVTWQEALRIKSEDEFLQSNKMDYGIARILDRSTPKGAKVFTFRQIPEAYTTREVIVGFQSAPGYVMRDALYAAVEPSRQPTWRLRFAFPAAQVRRLRVNQTAGGTPDEWRVSELHVLQGGTELPRAAQWRLRAWPNPWYVQLAFDNSPVTCWRSAQAIVPGMVLEVDFGKLETVDAVLIQAPHSQDTIRLNLEGMDAAGHWRRLSDAPEISDAPPPLGLRHAAIEELKARGIYYMVVFDDDPYAQDFMMYSPKWGIRQIAEMNHARLYQLI